MNDWVGFVHIFLNLHDFRLVVFFKLSKYFFYRLEKKNKKYGIGGHFSPRIQDENIISQYFHRKFIEAKHFTAIRPP